MACRIIKRPILLLEVLIAMVLVALCAFPLLSPHFMMLRQEKKHLENLEADRIANVVFVDIVEKMYQETITWEMVNDLELHPLADSEFKNYSINYRFDEPKLKPDKKKPKYGLYPLLIEITPKNGKTLKFFYEIFVEKENVEEEGESDDDED